MIKRSLLIQDIETRKKYILSEMQSERYTEVHRNFVRDIYDQFIDIVRQQPNLIEETIEHDYRDMNRVKRKWLTINGQRILLGLEPIEKDIGEWKYHEKYNAE